jgi:hypothetical protein
VLAALAAVCLTLMVWKWPRLSGPGWHTVAARLAAVGVTQLVTVTTLFAAVNAEFQFYGSWSDLCSTCGFRSSRRR